MIAPIAAALEFVDWHGKAMSILIVPVAGPLAIELAKLLKPIAGVEFHGSPLDLEANKPSRKNTTGQTGREP